MWPRGAGSAGIPARHERVSAKAQRLYLSTLGIKSPYLRADALMAGRDARAPGAAPYFDLQVGMTTGYRLLATLLRLLHLTDEGGGFV